jgi:phage terminase small subunit
MSKLTRKQIREGLETVPMESILGSAVSSQLTAKQKKFAREVAQGATKAEAYRRAYSPNPAPSTLLGEPYRVAANPKVAAEIEAYQAAIEAARYRTPAALRELVIQSLVSVVINPETKDSVKVAAAKVLGTVTEVAAFTERKEIKTISSSADAKANVMAELKRLIHDNAEDATIVESQANDLLAELSAESGPGVVESAAADPHPAPTPSPGAAESQVIGHTIPSEVSPPPSISAPTPPTPLDSGEPPPSSF